MEKSRKDSILEYLKKRGGASVKELCEALGGEEKGFFPMELQEKYF